MATWNGTPKTFLLERYIPGKRSGEAYCEYQNVEFNWDYGTVSDTLTILETDKQGTKKTIMGNQEAEALLYMLMQWYNRYEGTEELNNFLKDILDGK